MARDRIVNINIAKKYFPKKAVIDTVRDAHKNFDKRHDVLADAFSAWNSLEDLRIKEKRHERYVFGDQWGDRIVKNGVAMTEKTNILLQGNVPLQNNRIRNIVRQLSTVSEQPEPVCVSRERISEKGRLCPIQYNMFIRTTRWDYPLALYNLLILDLVFVANGEEEDKWTRIS